MVEIAQFDEYRQRRISAQDQARQTAEENNKALERITPILKVIGQMKQMDLITPTEENVLAEYAGQQTAGHQIMNELREKSLDEQIKIRQEALAKFRNEWKVHYPDQSCPL